MQSLGQWKQTIDQMFSRWLHGVDNPKLIRFVRDEMGSYGFEMWPRAGREISTAYTKEGNPLKALSRLKPHVPTLHLCVHSEDPGYLPAQQSFAAANPWFAVRELKAHSHFPMFEVPDQIVSTIEGFVR
jgi:pimeloyl-ACP methyl ester carboxylesterase